MELPMVAEEVNQDHSQIITTEDKILSHFPTLEAEDRILIFKAESVQE